MTVPFAWYAPTHGDGFHMGCAAEIEATPDYIVEVARAAEEVGFESILIPAGPTCTDALITATHIVCHTKRIRPLPAIRPGFVAPTVAAKMAATLDHVSGGRVSLNIVTGGSPPELAMDGDFVEHDARYRRTAEFIAVMKRVWSGDDVDFAGEFYRIRGATLRPRPAQTPFPRLYLGGSSEAALAVAAEHIDRYLMWGEPIEMAAQHIERVRSHASGRGRTGLRYGLRITLVVAETEGEAWRRAQEMVARVDERSVSKVARYLSSSDSKAQQRIQSTRDFRTTDRCYWTGMTAYRSGNSTALVGSYAQVAESLRMYVRAGISEFIFSGYPHLEMAFQVGRYLLPLVN
jgi:alkanesulfonate monooxygenase